MLELRPTCENCNRELPPNSTEAMICSFECTFCRTCVEELLENVCPNCGGGFCPRPIRPQHNWRRENFIGKFPATLHLTHQPINTQAHRQFAASIKTITPENR